MIKEPVAARYAEALFEHVKTAGQLEEVSDQLTELAELIQRHADLRQLLLNPDVEVSDKLTVLDRVLGRSWSSEIRAFVHVVLTLDRAAFLVEMCEAFQERVDEERGLLRVVARSAHPLSASLRATLTKRLEALQGRQVSLTEEVVPELLGGLQVLLDHRILDGSLQTKLRELRQRLKSVRVN